MMDSITVFSKDCCEDRIKFLKKMVKTQIVWATFIVTITAYDCQSLYLHPTTINGLAVGSMLITSLWTLLFLFDSRSDLKAEKLKHKFLTELHDTQLASGERQQYLNVKKYYETLIQQLKEKQNDDKPIVA